MKEIKTWMIGEGQKAGIEGTSSIFLLSLSKGED